jgi:putative flippase GtrA
MAGRDYPAWVGQSARFGVVGVIALAIDAAVLAATVAIGWSPYAGRVASLACMVCATWWLNRSLTFRTTAAPSWREFAHYVALAFAGVVINYSLYSLVLWATGDKWLGLLVGTAVTAVFNFFRYRKLFAAR